MHSFSRSCSVVLVVASLVAACGGAAPAPQAPPAEKKESEPDSIAEAQDQIARARAELEQAVAHREPAADSKATSDTTSTPAKKSTTPQPGAAPPPATKPADAVAPKPEDTCGNPCRALASMRRAVTALCRMTGDEDGRCVEAKRTLSTSEARVASCPCAKG